VRKWRAKRARSNATCLVSKSDKSSLRRSRLDFGKAETECRQSRQPDHLTTITATPRPVWLFEHGGGFPLAGK